MTSHSTSPLRGALALLNVRFILQQIILALLVFGLSVLWLRIPDASAIDVIGSVLLALIVLAVAGIGESSLILRLSGQHHTLSKLLRGALLLFIGAALWLGWSVLLQHLHGDDYLRAGYLNSRFPHSLRNLFSFEHILLCFGWLWATLRWIMAGIIAVFVFTLTASIRPLRAIVRALSSLSYWSVLILGTASAIVITGLLLEWTPGQGLTIEMLSLVLRLSVAMILDATIACFLLAILAVCERQTDALYLTPAGTPDESHPRTEETP
ncbi:hypothetical protein [Acidicapsa ligni]|uniref:hypothetical protein n=1 Tax=Acidicapsa ligni TaxID=542300 RepID=UPI0021E0ACD4|nr:hypothetical protein [Acidicapsa ligni]